MFNISAQNIDFARRGGSNEYPQSMFWIKKIRKISIPCKPQLCSIKVAFKGVYMTRTCFLMLFCYFQITIEHKVVGNVL